MTNEFDENQDAEQTVNAIEEDERGDGRSAESIPEGEPNNLPPLVPAEPGQVVTPSEEPTDADADQTAAGPAEEREAGEDDDANPVSTGSVE